MKSRVLKFWIKREAIHCGFDPVSWCKWDGNYAPDDWNPHLQAFKETVMASTDYVVALSVRESALKKAFLMVMNGGRKMAEFAYNSIEEYTEDVIDELIGS